MHAKSPVSQCIYRCWNCQTSKKPSYIGQKPCFSQEKKIIFIAKILPSGAFQINFFVFCLKEKLFHWNRFDIRKHKECDFISLLGKDAVTEDIYTWIRLSAQQGISFDPTMKLNALFIRAGGFFCGKYNEVANPSSGLEQERGWRGNNSGLDSTVSQEENSWPMSVLKMGFLGNDALQLVTSPCIIAGSFPACPALLESLNIPSALVSLPLGPQCATGITGTASLCFWINPSPPPCWSDNLSIHGEKMKINHIAAGRMGKESTLSLLPWHYKIKLILCPALYEIAFLGVVEFLGILWIPLGLCCGCL